MKEMNRPIFVSTYTTGFQDQVTSLLQKNLLHTTILDARDGILFYTTKSRIQDVAKLPYVNNSFILLYESKHTHSKLPMFTEEVIKNSSQWIINLSILPWNLSYRVKWFIENKPSSIPITMTRNLENSISKRYKNYHVDINNPAYELRISLRKWEKGVCLFRITKKNAQKWLEKGELRPEFAYLISSFTYFNWNDVILEPFTGYWAIPKIIAQHFPYKTLIVNDIDKHRIAHCKKTLKDKGDNIIFLNEDALHFSQIHDTEINHIVTDPPWWLFERLLPNKETFYEKAIQEMKRILKSGGTLTICTAQKEITQKLLQKYDFTIHQEIHTLVSGKKVAVYFTQKP